MEFLDISLTKDLSLLLHAIHSLFFKENHFFSDFKNLNKKSVKQENSSLFMNNIF